MTHFDSDGNPLEELSEQNGARYDDAKSSKDTVSLEQELAQDAIAARAAERSLMSEAAADAMGAQGTLVQKAEPTQVQARSLPAAPTLPKVVEAKSSDEAPTTGVYEHKIPVSPGQTAPTQVYEAQQKAYAEQQARAQAEAASRQRAAAQAQAQAQQQAFAQQAQAARVAPASPVVSEPRREKSGIGSLLWGLLGGIIGAAALVLAFRATGIIGIHQTNSIVPAATTGQTIDVKLANDDVTIAQAVSAKTLPSVVSIYCSYNHGSGMGSGVILDKQGNIITNNHVVKDAVAISVTIEGKSYDAIVVGTDPSSDLAVIRADLKGALVTPIEVGDSSKLVVGDWVMTVGSPFGFDQSVSAGIVSSLYRNELMTSATGNTLYANLIQVDAAINPGNSGGALVNSEGKLVGIATLFSSDTESFAGIGFAIPGNYAVDIANKIISGEQVTHAYIGLSMQTVNSQNAQANNLAVNQGAYVAEVAQNGPAEAAGIQVGDVVVRVNNEEIASADGMILCIRSHSIGETVEVVVVRGDEEMSFDVTLGSDDELQARQKQELEEYQQQVQQQQEQNDPTLLDNPFGDSLTDEEWQQIEQWYNQLFSPDTQTTPPSRP